MDLMQFVVVPGYLPALAFELFNEGGMPSIQLIEWQAASKIVTLLLTPVFMVMWMADELGRPRAYLFAALLMSPLFTALLLLAMGPSLQQRMARRLDEELEDLKRENERDLRELTRVARVGNPGLRNR
jgi:MFS family permease